MRRTVTEEAKRQLALGRVPIPLGHRTKDPGSNGDGWHERRYGVECFSDDAGIGLLVGKHSGNLVDVDLDCDEARLLAPAFLPPTEMRHGRPPVGETHWWFVTDEALPFEKFVDVGEGRKKRGKTIVELRSNEGDKGEQTVIPPSVHEETGEQLIWTADGEPAKMRGADLRHAVRRLAAATLLARHFPKPPTEQGGGSRHDFCLALGAMLLRAGWQPDDAHAFVGNVAFAGGSDDPEKRAASVYDTAAKLAAGEQKVTGIPRLVEIASREVVERAMRWLELKGNTAAPATAASAPYTADELAAIAIVEGCTVAELAQRWIIQRANSYYVRAGDGYVGPRIVQELGLALRDLDRAPLIREGKNKKDESIKLTPTQIVVANGSLANAVYADLTLDRSTFDAKTRTFYEAACPPRKIDPRFDPQIDEWLRLLGGARADKLADWLATSHLLAKQTSALYLQGPRGVGKTMLAHGLARRWTQGTPTLLEDVIGSFNSSLVRCPLVFGDEQAKVPDSKILRAFIGSDGLTLKRKFLPDTSLRGAPRLILAGNRDDLLHFDREVFAQDDVDAVASRFLHIKAGKDAADYLISIGGRAATDRWVDGDLIARHVAHLAQTRQVAHGARFLVEGDADEMARKLATGGTVRGLIVEAVARALAAEARPVGPGFLAGDGQLRVNATWLHDRWSELVGRAHHPPTLKNIGSTLEGIATGPMMRVGPKSGHRLWYYPLNSQLVIEHARALGIGDDEFMLRRIENPLTK